MRKSLLSPKDLSHAIGVSESSLRRWIDAGLIPVTRTAGGHRRVSLSDAVRYIRDSRATLVRPELLGLGELKPTGLPSTPQADEQAVLEALAAGDDVKARGLLLSMYLAGRSVAAIFDGPIRAAMHRLGELWMHDEKGILTEHLAVDILLRTLAELRLMLPLPPADAPAALGAAPDGDPYLLPSMLAAIVLADAGYRDLNFGAGMPVNLLAHAARDRGARLVWVSVSSSASPESLTRQLEKLADELKETRAHLIIGGRMVQDYSPPREHGNLHVAHSMAELSALARGMNAARLPTEQGHL